MALHPAIEALTRTKRQNQDYDGAIRDATEYIEVKLQQEIGSKTINTKLVEEAFTTSKFKLSRKNDLNFGGQNLFHGFFGLIRNDRGHWKNPEQDIEIKCTDDDQCEWYLGLASLLLFYIENQNLVNAPMISSYRPVIGAVNQLEIDGTNLSKGEVYINGQTVPITQQKQSYILVTIPTGISEGTIQVKVGQMMSNTINFILGDTTHKNMFEVLETNIALYSDEKCLNVRPEVKGVKIKVYEKGRSIIRVNPTTIELSVGDYISQEGGDWTIGSASVGETWYIDSASGEKKYAWTGSAIYKGHAIGKVGEFKPLQISIRPSKILLGKDERRALQAQYTSKDTMRVNVEFVTDKAEWSSEDPSIAYINNKGELIAKKYGKTFIHCKFQNLHDKTEVEVASITSGQIVEYFGGMTHLQEIKFDSQGNLLISNQSPVVAMITHEGKFVESIIRLPAIGDSEQQIDRISLNQADDLYARAAGPGGIFKFLKSENYQRAHTVREGSFGDVIEDRAGTLYVGSFDQQLIKIDSRGEEQAFATQFIPLGVQLLSDGNLVLSSGDWIYIYEASTGNMLREIEVLEMEAISDIAVKDDVIFAIGFHGKNLAKVDPHSGKYSVICSLPGVPGGIAVGQDGCVYVSIFDEGDSIYKIYL